MGDQELQAGRPPRQPLMQERNQARAAQQRGSTAKLSVVSGTCG